MNSIFSTQQPSKSNNYIHGKLGIENAQRFNDNILRLLRAEIQYELDHSPPSQGTMNSKMHLYEFREVREMDDDMAEFLHEYMKNKDSSEFIRWLNNIKSFIEPK